ncbi:hypothetical protein H109_08011 [Trichophyton interdigitale MR816]|uniref:Uncharacterized protein n=1 Tax=Trichophyton interdigitale (strain MR816) TaxID=1215338 RepID=A0A059IWK3_TRIIM|nr:hypothetical protein H101_04636 [Trichophyton interdigitale H6]KDB20016.1 hypothetical protein H109_08011 [Trichophyton interdigitale MR816]
MSRQFNVYYIPDLLESNLSSIYSVDKTLCAIENSLRFRGDGYWLVACPSKPNIPNAELIYDTIICNKEYFLQAAADAVASDNPGARLAYEKVAEQNGLVKALEGHYQLYKDVLRQFLNTRSEGVVMLKERLGIACGHLASGRCEHALWEIQRLCDFLFHIWEQGEIESDRNPQVLRQSLNHHQIAIATQKGRIEAALQNLRKARDVGEIEKSAYSWLVGREQLAHAFESAKHEAEAIERQLRQLSPPLYRAQDSVIIQRPQVDQAFLLCFILLSQLEDSAITKMRSELDEILSWGSEDWELKFQRTDGIPTEYHGIFRYLRHAARFESHIPRADEVEKQYGSLTAGILSMSENAAIQVADPKSETFSSVQNLMILCAGKGWYLILPAVAGNLRAKADFEDVVEMARCSPLYEDIQPNTVRNHLDSILMLLEPRDERERNEASDMLGEVKEVSLRGKKRPSPCPDGESDEKRLKDKSGPSM